MKVLKFLFVAVIVVGLSGALTFASPFAHPLAVAEHALTGLDLKGIFNKAREHAGQLMTALDGNATKGLNATEANVAAGIVASHVFDAIKAAGTKIHQCDVLQKTGKRLRTWFL